MIVSPLVVCCNTGTASSPATKRLVMIIVLMSCLSTLRRPEIGLDESEVAVT